MLPVGFAILPRQVFDNGVDLPVGKVLECRHCRVRVVGLGVPDLPANPAFAPPFSNSSEVRCGFSTLSFIAVAVYAAFLPEESRAVRGMKSVDQNDHDNSSRPNDPDNNRFVHRTPFSICLCPPEEPGSATCGFFRAAKLCEKFISLLRHLQPVLLHREDQPHFFTKLRGAGRI